MKNPFSPRARKPKKKSSPSPAPFQFVFDCLYPKEPVVRPMFGCHAIYLGSKIYLILRKKKDLRRINGVWIATSR
ncbi:MAG TPA: hypothetical protein VL633_13060, partial [Bacteroidota bacterium]|nr:hypothetical protein [Bacteroidota bacterium]